MSYILYLCYFGFLFILCFIYLKYFNKFYYPKLLESFFFKSLNTPLKHLEYYTEYSCKFSPNRLYNDTRYIYLFNKGFKGNEKAICNKFKVHPILVNFYFDRITNNKSNKPIIEFILGFDSKENTQKLYYTQNSEIYGMAISKNKIKYKYYKYILPFHKKKLDNLVGNRISSLVYNLFDISNINTNKSNENYIFSRCESNNLNNKCKNVESYHMNVMSLNLKIGDNKNKIKQLIKISKSNNTNIDTWIIKNYNKYLSYIALTKKDKTSDKVEICFYYYNDKII
jgi:hypothetical protein